MIEAVNSVLSNASVLRGPSEQVDSAAVTVVAESAQSVANAPRAPYISPYIFVDVNYNKAVLQIRNGDSGDVLQQFPSESTLEARQRAESFRQYSQQANQKLFSEGQSARQPQPQSEGNAVSVVSADNSDVPVTISGGSFDSGDSYQAAPVSIPSVGTTSFQSQIASAALISSSQVASGGSGQSGAAVNVSA
jgi:hypothetical protein